MSETGPDRTNPDHEWTGDGSVASTDDLVDVVAHVKAWAAREIAAVKAAFTTPAAPPAPVVTSIPDAPAATRDATTSDG